MEKRKKLGIALGGGGPRGTAHIGALQALLDEDIKPDALSGTSIGAVVATLFAFGTDLQNQLELAKNMSWWKITKFTLSKYGITSNENLSKFVDEYIGKDKKFSDARLPLAIMTCDITTGEKVVLKKGNILKAILASSSLPGVYTPVVMNKRMLVDGGLVENVPLSPLREMGADITIGINLMKKPLPRKPERLNDIISNSFFIMLSQQNHKLANDADIVVEPDLPTLIKTDSKSLDAMYESGYKEMQKHIPKLKKLLK